MKLMICALVLITSFSSMAGVSTSDPSNTVTILIKSVSGLSCTDELNLVLTKLGNANKIVIRKTKCIEDNSFTARAEVDYLKY